ncbi:MAG: hydroxyacid dehydrogenase, partial [Actinomycetota bacterium]|nr:hydroxyacid dehydrogenase [Actinomycetota bacterium]
LIDDQRVFTSAAGAYAPQVAEHALALMLAGRRRLASYARARGWQPCDTQVLSGSTVGIVGCGGIGRALIGLLQPLDVEVLAVNRSGEGVPGAARTLPAERTSEIWPQSDVVVLAAPATAQTRHLVAQPQLAAMAEHAWLVNVARGILVDTAALVEALNARAIAGAALDVTDPEPLPDDHPLWRQPRALITPHVANPPHAQRRSLAQRVRENVERRTRGDPLIGIVDPQRGY